MNVLATTDISTDGNDCYIYKSVSLVEQFGMFGIIIMEKTTGWFDSSNIMVVHHTDSPQKAINSFIEHGGILNKTQRRNIVHQ